MAEAEQQAEESQEQQAAAGGEGAAQEEQMANGQDQTGGEEQKPGEGEPAWYEGISDEKALEFAKRNASLNDFAVEARGLRQKVSQAIVPPGKDASEEDIAAYHKRLGVPEAPEGYEFKLPEGVPEKFTPDEASKPVVETFQKGFHDLNLSKEQGAGIVDLFYTTLAAQDAAQEKALEKAAEKELDALKTEWGGDFKRNAEVSVRAAEFFGGDSLVELFETAVIDGIPLGDHPAITKAFAKIGLQMQEADPLLGTSQEERDTLQEQHADLTKQIMEAHDGGDRAAVKRLEAKRDKISAKIAGNMPIVGTAGRAA